MLKLQPRYRKILNLVIIFIALSMVMSWTTNDREKVSFMENAIHQLVLPFQKAFTSSTNYIRDTYMSLTEFRNVYEENKFLKEELEYYKGIEHQLNEARLANRRLTNLLDFKESTEFDLLPAMVIGRSPSTWYSTMTIAKGTNHDVKLGMPVVTHAGLVGRVIEVSLNSSKVKLIISPDSGITSFVQRTRDIGLVKISAENPGFLEITRLAHNADLRVGDTIMSSDLTGNFPKGLVIGEVVRVEGSDMEITALVRPSVDFERLEEVFIVTHYEIVESEQDAFEGED
ncbi:rod shape-determining protein MreC [Alkalicella caledoniensis]|uniref:Cell shape-determining protein MreC n=1 Tax=Alkalicella caledoniensis TaxID=2731377 RepID=A0A7G9W4J8_ALKCA|nr:rod shape-determining protein MreC [Alkalicella caledoniensis]QNO13610.1 rod shape-determining protein MreC [Alkalicella caledoniensis]